MSRLGSMISRSNRKLVRDTGSEPVTWNGNNYLCVGNVADSSKTLGEGGFQLEADFTAFITLDLLPTPGPKEKQTVIFRSKTYRIDKVAVLPGNSVVKLICNDPTR